MKSKPILRSFLLAAGSSLLAVSSSNAALETAYWDGTSTNGDANGGTGTWNGSNTNWDSLAAAGSDISWDADASGDDTASIGGTAATVTVSGSISLKNLTFTHTTGTYTITGGTLAFSSGGTITASNPPNTSTVNAIIQSNITGAPALNLTPMDGDDQFTLNPAASGSMSIGTVSGSGALGSEKLNLQGGAGSSGTIADANGVKVLVTSGSWTLNGNGSFGYGHAISAGTLTLNTNLNATHRSVALSGTGVLNYNVAGAVSATAATNASTDNGFRITGGTLDQTSGAAINTNASTTHIDLGGNLTFLGSNGANSNLHLGSGPVWLKDGNRQITVTNSLTTLTIGGVIQNDDTPGRALTKAGAGTLELRGTNTYNGATSVNAGTLAITGTGSINTSSGISVAAGGTLRYNSSTALTVAPTLAGAGTSNRAVLGGTGTINAAVTLNNLGDVLSPGNSPGIQSYTVGQTWASFSYDWEVNDFSDVTGLTAGSDFDQIGITGSLDLSGGSGSYILNVLGLTAGNVAGSVPNFSEINRSWTILTTTTGISNFSAANWTINTTGFTDPDTGTWALAQSGNNLVLSYTAVPEPRAALLGGLGMLMLLRRRRQ